MSKLNNGVQGIELPFNYHGQNAKFIVFGPRKISGGGYLCDVREMGLPNPQQSFHSGIDSLQCLLRSLSSVQSRAESLGVFPIDGARTPLILQWYDIRMETELLSKTQIVRIKRESLRTQNELAETRKGFHRNTNPSQGIARKPRNTEPQSSRKRVLVSRDFLWGNKPFTVAVTAPFPSNQGFTCKIKFSGISSPPFCEVEGDTQIHTLMMAISIMQTHLLGMSKEISWKYGNKSQLGLPVLLCGTEFQTLKSYRLVSEVLSSRLQKYFRGA